MIYLSWSIIHLITIFALICFGAFVAYKKHVNTRKILGWVTVLIGLNLYLAFDVGTRQQDLQRSSFDANVPSEAVSKTERKTLDRNDVKQTFQEAVKETK